MSSSLYVVRAANRDDAGFLLDSWLRSFRSSFFGRKITPWVYWCEHRKIVEELLGRCTVLVAADAKDPSVIWGYIVAELIDQAVVIHYVYVKELLRGQKVASELVRMAIASEPDAPALVYTHDTKGTDYFLDYLHDSGIIPEGMPVLHNPYLLFDTNG